MADTVGAQRDDAWFGDVRFEPTYRSSHYERWLLGFDATGHVHLEDGSFGYLYVFGLSDGWIKIGRTVRWDARRTALHQKFRLHGLTVEQVWKTEPIPAEELSRAETRVTIYARRLADSRRLYYPRGAGLSEEIEMFHGAGFDMVRAYADVIGRCEAATW